MKKGKNITRIFRSKKKSKQAVALENIVTDDDTKDKKNGQELIGDKQSSITTSDINTKRGSPVIGSAFGDNTNLSNKSIKENMEGRNQNYNHGTQQAGFISGGTNNQVNNNDDIEKKINYL